MLCLLGLGLLVCCAALLLSLRLLDKLSPLTEPELDLKKSAVTSTETPSAFSMTDSLLRAWGFACLEDHDSLLCIDLRYASSNTFAGRPFYHDLKMCWLHPLAANRLLTAASLLRRSHDTLRLLVYDATRPLKAQVELYAAACSLGAGRYVAVPWGGSVHNYGLAVDVGLADLRCRELDLGTPFDSFDSLAQPRYEAFFLKTGRLDSMAWLRRRILRRVMREAGFRRIDLEWWHFEALPIDTARVRFPIVP